MSAKQAKPFITASDLYNFKRCPYRPYLDRNGNPEDKTETHPLIELLWEAGVQYERKVMEMLRHENEELTFVSIDPDSPASEDLAQKTIAAMQAGTDYIYQGVLIDSDLLGRPDLLVKTQGASKFGPFSYYPM